MVLILTKSNYEEKIYYKIIFFVFFQKKCNLMKKLMKDWIKNLFSFFVCAIILQ